MPHTKITALGVISKLDGRRQADQQVTSEDVQDPDKLSKLLTSQLADVAEQKRKRDPKRIDFEDVVCGGVSSAAPTLVRLPHGFGGRVRWSVVDCTSTNLYILSGSQYVVGPQLLKSSTTDENTLVLESYFACTCTIRVEEAG